MRELIRSVSVQLDADMPGIWLVEGKNVIRNITRTSLWRLQNLLGEPTDTWATHVIRNPSIRLTWRIYSEEQS